jgi:GT2 family glycosyltransferase
VSISVVIPVYNQLEVTERLLCLIDDNVVKPDEVILIDNGSTQNYSKVLPNHPKLKIIYIKLPSNSGVNSSWNLGISKSTGSLISILNNDILISQYFFKKISEAMKKNPKVGIVVPRTVGKGRTVTRKSVDAPVTLVPLGKREGWAFTIRKEVTSRIKPIPSSLNRLFGDDYLFLCNSVLGYGKAKMSNNYCFHYGGITTIKEFSGKQIPAMSSEREIWLTIKPRIRDYILK